MKNVFELLQSMKAISPIDAEVKIEQINPETISLNWFIPQWRLYAEGLRNAPGDVGYSRMVSIFEYDNHIDRYLQDAKKSIEVIIETVKNHE